MELKKRLARELVSQLYDEKAAAEAAAHFARVVQNKEVPEEIKEFHISLNVSAGLRDILVETHLAKSRSEANRLIEQGAVSINGEKETSVAATIKNGSIIKVGKRRFAKVINTDTIGR